MTISAKGMEPTGYPSTKGLLGPTNPVDRINRKRKPLRWRTGPVPEGLAVFYKYFLDGLGVDYEVGEGNKEGNVIGNFHTEWQNIQWIPLSDILGLVENPQGGEG